MEDTENNDNECVECGDLTKILKYCRHDINPDNTTRGCSHCYIRFAANQLVGIGFHLFEDFDFLQNDESVEALIRSNKALKEIRLLLRNIINDRSIKVKVKKAE